MDISLFDFELPDALIAQAPSRNRDESRLLVLNREDNSIASKSFKDITSYFQKGDCLVVNNTKVFKARLLGKRKSGGEVEVFLVRRLEKPNQWTALVKPSRRLNENEEILFGDNSLFLSLRKSRGEGRWDILFESQKVEETIIEQFGHVPLPLYIKRSDTPTDVNRYQTIFADPNQAGAVAAPTAGFHFTDAIIAMLKEIGVEIAELTLHVGPGTFKPVSVDNIEDHTVDPEYAVLSSVATDKINKARQNGNKIITVGTTSTRTLESAEIDKDSNLLPFEKFVDLYIQPGYKFRVVDHLITNFHLPKSSLLILISAFAGREQVLDAYALAIKEKYRFYSYGDAMLIW